MLFHGGSGFTVLRCTSFALESCAHPDRRYSLADLLKYNFYLPFFFFGPIMTFDRFHAQVRGNPVGSQDRTGSPLGGSDPSSATSVACVSTLRAALSRFSPHPLMPRQLVGNSPLRHLASPR